MLKALFVSLRESWCDTTTDFGRLMLTIMCGIAEFERSLIRRRKRQGKQFGRPIALDNGQKRKVAEPYASGKTMPELPRSTALV